MAKNFIPIESNPEVFNEYSTKLGITNIPQQFQWSDVLGLDPELLSLTPGIDLTQAVLLLFPIIEPDTDTDTETSPIEEPGTPPKSNAPPLPSSLYFMKQTIGNACGTIGLLHCLVNLKDGPLTVDPDSFLATFIEATEQLSAPDRGKYLEEPPEGAHSIDSIHEHAAQQGQTEAPEADEDVDLHFVAFVVNPDDSHLYELDGRKSQPIDHGPSEPGIKLLEDVAEVVRKNFVEKANSLQFSLLALTAAADD